MVDIYNRQKFGIFNSCTTLAEPLKEKAHENWAFFYSRSKTLSDIK